MTDPNREMPKADEMELAYDRIQRLEWQFAPLVVLQAASDTGLLGLLAAEDTVTAAAAAEQLRLHPEVTVKVLRALAGMGILASAGDSFEMRAGYRPLFDPGSEVSHDAGLRHLFELSQRWAAELPEFLRSGEWTKSERTPEGTAAFVRSMRSLAYGITARLDAALDLSQARRLLDLGGGLGTYAIELCMRHPSLHGTVVDVEAVIEHTRAEIARHGLEDRLDALAGDYLDVELPGSMDVVLLANVLHQERPDAAAKLIARAAAALAPGGQLVVLDFTLEDNRREPLMGAIFAINMRLFGDTYSESDLRGWMERAGLSGVTRTDLSPNKFILVGRK
ncbi:MAG: methyltransferase [bacterium]